MCGFPLLFIDSIYCLKGNSTSFPLYSMFTGLKEYYCICGEKKKLKVFCGFREGWI